MVLNIESSIKAELNPIRNFFLGLLTNAERAVHILQGEIRGINGFGHRKFQLKTRVLLWENS